MTEFLLFTLYAPLASWGEIAVGEIRGSWDRPSRSAILGFVAASLGLTREEREAHAELDRTLGVAVRLDAPGHPMQDYHTTQTVSASQVKKRRPTTRAQLLATSDRETILSQRTYRQDALATIAVWRRGESRWKLQQLAEALRRPAFVLYAGRKANPLGLPVDPEVLAAPTIAAALTTRTFDRAQRAGVPLGRLRLAARPEVSHDTEGGADPGASRQRTERRRDTAPERQRWQFAERAVDVFIMPEGGHD